MATWQNKANPHCYGEGIAIVVGKTGGCLGYLFIVVQ